MANLTQEDIIDEIKKKTGVYKSDLRVIFNALEDTFIEQLGNSQLDDPVDIRLFPGFNVQAVREPVRPAKDPRNGEDIMAREKIKLHVKIRLSFRNKIEEYAGLIGHDERENADIQA